MIRVAIVTVDNLQFKIGTLSTREAREREAQRKAMVERGANDEEWTDRYRQTILAALLKGDPKSGWTNETLDDLDGKALQKLYAGILAESGLEMKTAENAPAATQASADPGSPSTAA